MKVEGPSPAGGSTRGSGGDIFRAPPGKNGDSSVVWPSHVVTGRAPHRQGTGAAGDVELTSSRRRGEGGSAQ